MFDITGFKRYPLQIGFHSDFVALSEKGDGKRALAITSPKSSNIQGYGFMQSPGFIFSSHPTPPTCFMRLGARPHMSASSLSLSYIEAKTRFNRSSAPMAAENGRTPGPQLSKSLGDGFLKTAATITPASCIYQYPAPTARPEDMNMVFPETMFEFDFASHKMNRDIVDTKGFVVPETAKYFTRLLDILLTLPTVISGPRGSLLARRASGRLAGMFSIPPGFRTLRYYGCAPAWLRSGHLAGILFGQAFLAMRLMSTKMVVDNIQATFSDDVLHQALNLLKEEAILEAKERLLYILRNIPEDISEDRDLVNKTSRLEWLWITKNVKLLGDKYLKPFSDGIPSGRLGAVLPEDLRKSYEAFEKETPNP